MVNNIYNSRLHKNWYCIVLIVLICLEKENYFKGGQAGLMNNFKGGLLKEGGPENLKGEVGGTNGEGGSWHFKGGPQNPAETMLGGGQLYVSGGGEILQVGVGTFGT